MSDIITFNTKLGPQAIGPYSTAKIYNGVLYLSGQIGLDPATMQLVSDDVEDQTRQVMKNMTIILGECKCEMTRVLKCTIYLMDMNDFTAVNNIYGQFFPVDPPARVAFAVQKLPKGAKVQIQATVAYHQ